MVIWVGIGSSFLISQRQCVINGLDAVCRYHFKSEHLPGEFKMKPSHGLVPPKDFNLITFRFDAQEPKVCVGRAVVTLNDSPSDTMQVNLTATSHIAKVKPDISDPF